MGLNRVNIMGRLGKDPELRRTNDGTAVCSFSLAVERDFSDESGKRPVDWVDVVVWRKSAEFVCKYFSKGQQAVVDGSLRQRSWEKDGVKHNTLEVLADRVYFGDTKSSGTSAAPLEELPEIGDVDGDLPL